MEANYRVKQTARKTTGGVSPQEFIQQDPLMPTLLNHESGKPPRKGFFGSPSGDSAAQQHSDTPRDPVQKQESEHSPQKKGDEGPANSTANHIRDDFMWTAPTSNIRSSISNEEEKDELVSYASSTRGSSPDIKKSPTAKTKATAITKCDRCRNMASNPECIPHPGSKKCERCYRGHKVCSWTGGPFRTLSSFGGNSLGKAKNASHAQMSFLTKMKQTSYLNKQQNNPKCTRCASFAYNAICERSDDPNDPKCKKCRKDKQSCSLAPNGKPFAKRKKSVSASTTGIGQTGEENDEQSEEGEEQNEGVETRHKKKRKTVEDQGAGPDGEENQMGEASDGNRSASPGPSSKKNQRDAAKRKPVADQDDNPSEDERSFQKKQKRRNTTALDLPSSSNLLHGISGLSGFHITGTRNASTFLAATAPRIIGVSSAVQGQINGRPHANSHSVSVGSSTAARSTGQPSEIVEIAQDRTIAVIERELRAAEVKAALHREIAGSFLKDAERAEEEVTTLKEELLTTVRRNANLVEGITAERKILIEQLFGSGADQRT